MSLGIIRDSTEPQIKRALLTFQSLVGVAEEFLKEGKYLQAAVSVQIAAYYASYNHHGAFVSEKLEEILRTIGKRATDAASLSRVRAGSDGTVKRVLHVLTAARDVGGDTRFVWRWIQRDPGRSHSVALTCQLNHEVPRLLLEAVSRTGGTCHVLDDPKGTNLIRRAQALRGIAGNTDAVFLHVYPEDVVPLMAFADKKGMPRIVFVVQADHQFWLGASISDLFVHLRESGMLLSKERRGIERERMAFLPITLEPIHSQASRSEAKENIGFSEDTVVLLSIARAVKYTRIGRPSFAEAAANVLDKHKNAVLLVIGPDNVDQWKIAHQKTGGRIVALGRRSDTRVYYEAADIYLDSFPFSSNTSLLEAASHGLPLVSYFPYSQETDVLGAGAPGFDRTLLRMRSMRDYEEIISRLIEDREYRVQIGERTKREVVRMHSGEGWNHYLQELYRIITVTPSRSVAWNGSDRDRSGELDLVLNRFYSANAPLGWVIGLYARHLPYGLRLQLLGRMLKVNRSFSFSMFLPKWLEKRLGGRIRGWRQLPWINRWLSAKS